MKNTGLVLAAALGISLVAVGVPAVAATANNTETGADTSNAADNAATAQMKQMHGHKHTMKHKKQY